MSGSPTWFQPAMRGPCGIEPRPRVSSEPSARVARPSPPVRESITVLPAGVHPPGESACAADVLIVTRARAARSVAAATRARGAGAVNGTPDGLGRPAAGPAAASDGKDLSPARPTRTTAVRPTRAASKDV